MPKRDDKPDEAYERRKEHERLRQAEQSRKARDISSDVPDRKNVDRHLAGMLSLKDFGLSYFPGKLKLRLSDSHLVAIDRIERCTNDGGLFALAMPRGGGKTAWAEIAALRAVLYGLRKFVFIVCATQKLANQRIEKLQKQLETNYDLCDDFPEVCHPFRKLEGINARRAGQLFKGKRTEIKTAADKIVFPKVDGSMCSGSVIQGVGIDGSIRGHNVMGPDGSDLRPDMIFIDDAQTTESAKSAVQTQNREQIILSDLMGLAGPDVAIAAVMLCTVIYQHDLSDRFLSPDKHPEWQGVRTEMLEAFPTNMGLWDQYGEIRRESFRSGDRGDRANRFYENNRTAMDDGARVSWPERMKTGELSGIQSAMNLYIDNPRAFWAEYQNRPQAEVGAFAKEIIPSQVASRLSGFARSVVPRDATRLTAFVDVGSGLHWYMLVAWNPTFGGSAIDYGTWPQQSRGLFMKSDPRPSLQVIYPGLSESARVYAGLNDLCNRILAHDYYREGTQEGIRVERCLIDCSWGEQTTTVHQFCRSSPFSSILIASKGMARTLTSRGVAEFTRKPGERTGYHWLYGMTASEKGRTLKFDADAWKSFLHERLTTAPAARGYLCLFGRDAGQHEMLSEHCAAEQSEPVTYRNQTFDKWLVKPHSPDNDLWDCLVGNCVAASFQGLTWDSAAASGNPTVQEPQKHVKWSEVQAAKDGRK
jgi:Phage terminase large subunit (GpA)